MRNDPPSPSLSFGIIDDEQASIDNIKGLLHYLYQHQAVSIIEANDFNTAIEVFNLRQVDVLFLDITLGIKNGFEVLDKLGAHMARNIIIVSASETHAFKAFHYSQVRHYLLKPVTINEIQTALQKCILPDTASDLTPARSITEEAGGSFAERDSLVIPNRNGFQLIKISQIAYLEANGSYCNIFLTDGTKITHSRNMKYVHAQLPEQIGFIRVHKSYIVNKARIQAYDSMHNQLLLEGGAKINVTLPVKELMDYLQ